MLCYFNGDRVEDELWRRKAQREQNAHGKQQHSTNSRKTSQEDRENGSDHQAGRKSYWQKKREADEEALRQRQNSNLKLKKI